MMATLSEQKLSQIPVLPRMSAWEYLTMCRATHPELWRRLNPARVPVERVAQLYAGIAELSTHFESKLESGRGDSYRQAQNSNYLIRRQGVLRLFDVAVPPDGEDLASLAVLDALGGNGTLTRIVRACREPARMPFIVTSDVAGRMIESALEQGLPAIRQPLQDLIWFEDETFDAVIVAYGTHHLRGADRPRAIGEAFRIAKPGARVVLQDFEIGCPTTRWYEEVLDRYTSTGHRYEYFTRAEFRELLATAGFEDVQVFAAYDPLIHFADDAETARRELLDYVFTLFALEKLLPAGRDMDGGFWDELEAVVRSTSTFAADELPPDAGGVAELTVVRDGDRWRAEIPRVCLVGTGRRP
jgi:SAM-dependent methyltransferase